MDPAHVAARESIRELVARYAHFADRGRFDELALLFTEDGVLEANDLPPARGRDAIRAFLGGARERLAAAATRPLIRHHVSSLTIDLDGPDAATAASYFLVITEAGPDHWGRYRDRLGRQGDEWRFLHRRVHTEGAAPGARLGPGSR